LAVVHHNESGRSDFVPGFPGKDAINHDLQLANKLNSLFCPCFTLLNGKPIVADIFSIHFQWCRRCVVR
jgi:hypothetical protein